MRHSTIRIVFVLFLFLICFPLAELSFAEEFSSHQEGSTITTLKEYVVSDTRLPSVKVDLHSVPAKITIITAEDIQRTGARTVQEAIQYSTGIVMYNEVGNAFEHRIDLRGFNSQPAPSISVFVDGMRVNEPNFNTVNFDLIPVEIVERIEIVPGSNAIFGQDTLGGVVNIITKRRTDKQQVTAETAFGSYQRERYNINAGGPIGKFDYYANFTRETENGFRDVSSGRISRFFGKFGFRPTNETDLTVSYTYVKDRLSQAGASPIRIAEVSPEANVTPGDFFDREYNVVRINANQNFPFGFSVAANAYYRNLQEASFLVSKPFNLGESFPTSITLGDTETWGETVQVSHKATPFGHRNELVFGSEFAFSAFATETDFALRDTKEYALGAFVQDTLNITPDIIFSGGLRYDRSELDFIDKVDPSLDNGRDFDRVTPRAGITYLVNPEASVYFNYSQGFRFPTVVELFAIGGGFTSNPDLNPVRSHNYELGARAKIAPWGHVALALYQINLRDEIFLTCIDCDGSAFDGINRNVDKTRRRGVEVTLKVRPVEYFDGTVNYTFTEAQFRSKRNFGSGSSARSVDVGDTIPLVPKNRLSVIGNFYPNRWWTVTATGLYVSTQFFQNDEDNTRERLSGYFVLNGKVSYKREVPGGRLESFLLLNNILNSDYFTRGIYATDTIPGGDGSNVRFVIPAPGISVFGGISYQFEAFPG